MDLRAVVGTKGLTRILETIARSGRFRDVPKRCLVGLQNLHPRFKSGRRLQPPTLSTLTAFKLGLHRPIPVAMSVDPISASAATREIQREILVLKKQQDVEKDVASALIELVKDAPKPAPGRIDTYA